MTDDWAPLTGVDRAMARRMERVVAVPLATEFTHVDVVAAMDKVKALRDEGLRATFNTIVVAACARGLREFPQVAAEVDFEEMKRRIPSSPNIGVAVAAPRGLVLPVVREVVGKPFRTLAAETDAAVQAAREGSTDATLYTGGHISITNMGNLPIYGGVPLPNTPQIAILGVSGAWDAVVPRDGQPVITRMCRITIGLDHRALDGMTAGRFLVTVKDAIEDPESLEVTV
jgi:pyruvate/2-oxoglutarate dehydrogenase complex dihydrolipoamide acyltransferase (E2) component